MIFCLGEGSSESQGSGYHKNLMAWNKPVTESRFEQIKDTINTILSDFTLDAREGWEKEWGRVRDSQWAKIAKIPEFDLELTKKITGLSSIPVDTEKTIEIEGKKFTVSELKDLLARAK